MRRSSIAAAAVTLALISLGATAGCATPSSSQPPAGTSAAPASGSALDAASFAAAIKRPGTVVVDVRTPAEFAAGHLLGAINLDVQGTDFASKIAGLDKSKTYALYCHSGNRSGVALRALQQAGFTQVFHLSGGITAWIAAGNPTVTS